MQKYKENLLQIASSLDAVSQCNCKLTQYVQCLVDSLGASAVKETCLLLSKIAEENKENEKIINIAKAFKNSLITYIGYTRLNDICSEGNNEDKLDDSRTLDELMNDLKSLVGLKNVKSKVQDIIDYQRVQKEREKAGLKTSGNTLHLAFTGNPGTGKTTVARIVGRIYNKLGLLSKGHFVEVSRTDLIAGYQGQTALKVKKVIEKAKGGVLFIDEAYSITENEHMDSYGRECLTELTKALEDYRDDLAVIVAGYTEPMNVFFHSNPGLRSRFNTFIEFEDYNQDELFGILKGMCLSNDYKLSEDIASEIYKHFEQIVNNKPSDFSNGRYVRNIFESITIHHARRVSKISNPSKEDLVCIKVEDFDSNEMEVSDKLCRRAPY